MRRWDGEFVVFNPLSGQTHCLDVVGARVLARILEGPATAHDLKDELARFLEVDNDARLAELVDRALDNLDDLGIVHPGP
ncbi:MAG: HPr-rel-A system PqqD family peptide chaperone [Kiloniellales bacterium]|nr:HPr-rel-A system PqqD family peptide chaperone [Kiloniellales bacterium]